MKIKRIVIPTLTILIIASQLVGCASSSQKEMLNMINNQESITIEIAEPINQEQGTQQEYVWVELASLNTYPEFRDVFDDTLGITAHGDNGKNGVVYVDTEGNQTNNSTLYYAFMNEKFISNCWENTDNMRILLDAVKNNYADVDSDAVARVALLNAYFNVYPDSEPNYFNGNETLTRAEFLAGTYRAGNPVSEINASEEFIKAVDSNGSNENNRFASQMTEYSYLGLSDKSLNNGTYNGTISRAEAIYTLVQMYYADEYATITGNESCYNDCKDGGDIATKLKFIETDKETGVTTEKDYWMSYELSYAIQNPDKGMPDDLYKAMVVAYNHNLINGEESRWDEGLTKGEALNFLVKVYEDLGTITSADRGASTGEVITTDTNGENNEDANTQANADVDEADNEYIGFSPDYVTYNKDTGEYTFDPELMITIKEDLPQYSDLTDDELRNFLIMMAEELSICRTPKEVYDALNCYDAESVYTLSGKAANDAASQQSSSSSSSSSSNGGSSSNSSSESSQSTSDNSGNENSNDSNNSNENTTQQSQSQSSIPDSENTPQNYPGLGLNDPFEYTPVDNVGDINSGENMGGHISLH